MQKEELKNPADFGRQGDGPRDGGTRYVDKDGNPIPAPKQETKKTETKDKE